MADSVRWYAPHALFGRQLFGEFTPSAHLGVGHQSALWSYGYDSQDSVDVPRFLRTLLSSSAHRNRFGYAGGPVSAVERLRIFSPSWGARRRTSVRVAS